MSIPEDKCPKCGEQMERGISEYGQVCPACMHYEDDPFWSMQGEYIEPNGEETPNPRAAEIPLYNFVRELKAWTTRSRAACGKFRDGHVTHPTNIAYAEGLADGLEEVLVLLKRHGLLFESMPGNKAQTEAT